LQITIKESSSSLTSRGKGRNGARSDKSQNNGLEKLHDDVCLDCADKQRLWVDLFCFELADGKGKRKPPARVGSLVRQ
jgi:hypothetical protein